MNVYTIKLDPIVLRRDQAYYALQAIIHTILVQRTIGLTIKPKEMDSPAFDLTYIMIDDRALIDKVETKIRELVKSMGQRMRFCLTLCSDVTNYGFLGSYIEHAEWERWYIEFIFAGKADSLENTMNSILDHCSVPPQHIPTTDFFFDLIDPDATSLFDRLTPFFS